MPTDRRPDDACGAAILSMFIRHLAAPVREGSMSIAIFEEIARKLGGSSVLGAAIRS